MSKLPESDPTAKRFFPSRGRWPRILFTGLWDNANLAHRLARAVNTFARAEIARCWVLQRNPYGYVEDMIGPPPEVHGDFPAGLVQWFRHGLDWIVTAGDGDYDLLKQIFDVLVEGGAKAEALAVTHSGTAYRELAKDLNRADWNLGAKVRFVGFDSLHLKQDGLDLTLNEEIPTFPYWASYDPIPKPVWKVSGDEDHMLRVCHSPSRRSSKGTELILGVLNRLARDKILTYDLVEKVTVEEAIKRRGKCHVFVDQLNPEVGGFGCSAVEAMATGCAVVADVWRSQGNAVGADVPHPPIVHAGTEAELEVILRGFASDRDLLHTSRHQAFAWAEKYASPEFVGGRFLRLLEEGWR